MSTVTWLKVFSCFICRLSRTCRPAGACGARGFGRFYTPSRSLSGSTIAFTIRSVDHSLFAHLIPSGGFNDRCKVRAIQNVLFKQALSVVWNAARHSPLLKILPSMNSHKQQITNILFIGQTRWQSPYNGCYYITEYHGYIKKHVR